MVGEKFGKLLVIKEIFKNKNGHIKFLCQCDCGNTCEVFGTHLRQQKIVSCKCKNKLNGVSSDMWYKIINSGIKTRVKRNGLEINITKEYVNKLYLLQNGKCKLSGVEITLPKTWRDRTYSASLDRIDSNKGYVIGNVQWVHKDINFMRGGLSIMEFIIFCRQVVKNNANFNITDINFDDVQFSGKRKYFGSTGLNYVTNTTADVKINTIN